MTFNLKAFVADVNTVGLSSTVNQALWIVVVTSAVLVGMIAIFTGIEHRLHEAALFWGVLLGALGAKSTITATRAHLKRTTDRAYVAERRSARGSVVVDAARADQVAVNVSSAATLPASGGSA